MSTVYLEKVARLPQIYNEEMDLIIEEGIPVVSRNRQRSLEAEMLKAISELEGKAKEVWLKFRI